jgi:hypothetical protein
MGIILDAMSFSTNMLSFYSIVQATCYISSACYSRRPSLLYTVLNRWCHESIIPIYTQAINEYIHTTSNIHHDQRLNITNVNLWFPVVLCFLKIDLHERFYFFDNSKVWDGDCTSGVLCHFLISMNVGVTWLGHNTYA